MGNTRKPSGIYEHVTEIVDVKRRMTCLECKSEGCEKLWKREGNRKDNTSNIAKHLWFKHGIEVKGINVRSYGKKKPKQVKEKHRKLEQPEEGDTTVTDLTPTTSTSAAGESKVQEGPAMLLPTTIDYCESDSDQSDTDTSPNQLSETKPALLKLDTTRDKKEMAQVLDDDSTEIVEKAMDGAKDSKPLSQVLKEICAPSREMGIQGGEMSSIDMYYVIRGSIAPVAISTPKASDQRVEEEESSFLDKQEVMTSNSLEAVVSERSLPAEDAKACSNVSPDQVCCDGVNSGRRELSSPYSQQPSSHADSSDQLTVGAEAMDEEVEDDLDSPQDAPTGPCNQGKVSSEGAAGGVIQDSLPAPVADLQHSEAFFRYPGASGDWFPDRKFDYQLKQRNAKRQPVFGEPSPRPSFDQPHAMPLLYPEVAVKTGEITLDQMLTVSPSKRRKKSEPDEVVDGHFPPRAGFSDVDHPPSNCSLSQEVESLHTEEDMQSSTNQLVRWNPVDDVQHPLGVEPPDFIHSSEIFEACDDHDLAEMFSLSDPNDLHSVLDDILREASPHVILHQPVM